MRRHRQIALLGFPGVEKSSLAHHFVYKHFYNEYDPNIKTKLTIIDNARSDLYTINHIDFENSDVYILVYAIDDLQSFKMNEYFFFRIPIVLVGNKIDRNDNR
ncbi:unnamed protein product, partial [Rotaria sordida]